MSQVACVDRGVHGRLSRLERTHTKELLAMICLTCGGEVGSQIGLSLEELSLLQVADR